MKTPEQLIKEAVELMGPKRRDYTTGGIWENFERSESVIKWFEQDKDKVYATLIATKLARIASLRKPGRKPNNESLEDSFKDLINYVALWGSDVCQSRE